MSWLSQVFSPVKIGRARTVAAPPPPPPMRIDSGRGRSMEVPKELEAEMKRAELYSISAERDLAQGQKRGEEIFKEGSLGRLDPMIMQARQQQAAQGFTNEENEAMRAQNMQLNQQMRGDQRAQRIAAAAEGVRGNRALSMQSKMLAEQSAQKAGLERDLFLKGIDARRQGMADLTAAQQYNIEQQNKELQGRLTTEMGYGALGSANRGAAIQAIVGQQQAAAAAQAGKGGGKK